MKTNTFLRNCIALALLLTLSGCRENYTLVTTIFPDGSCERVITLTSDSAKIPDVAFPLPIDSSWEVTWKAPAKKGEKYELTARKRFTHIDSMNLEYARLTAPEKIRITVSVERKFRWFYTYFTYREKLRSFNPFMRVPLSQFMTEDEIRRYLAGEKSDSLKEKRDAWEARNLFEEYLEGLKDLARTLNDPALPLSLIEEKKEVLFAEVMTGGSEDIADETARALGSPVVRKHGKEVKAIVDEIMRKTTVAAKADGDYVCTVVMPGTILDTNTEEIKGNSAVWKFSDDQLGLADFEMVVESKSVNVWPMLVTALVVIGLVVLPALVRMRHRRQAAPVHA